MTERNRKLVMDYGPRFVDRSGDIMDEMLHLSADACSVMTDEEWRNCAEAMIKFVEELKKVRNLVEHRLEEAGVEL